MRILVEHILIETVEENFSLRIGKKKNPEVRIRVSKGRELPDYGDFGKATFYQKPDELLNAIMRRGLLNSKATTLEEMSADIKELKEIVRQVAKAMKVEVKDESL